METEQGSQYVRGYDLVAHEIESVKACFIHRDTAEHPWNMIAREFLATQVGPVPTDEEWIKARGFRFNSKGQVAGCLLLGAITSEMLHERSRYGQA